MELQEFVSTLQDAYRMVKLENGAMMRDLTKLQEENKMLVERVAELEKANDNAKTATGKRGTASKKTTGK